ncbi:Hypothetical protein D9617_24g017550 [Elsinoe fawcettii]|nr:Hypothetical protein D9617_24g017550 [Elsinoe fawcettii]
MLFKRFIKSFKTIPKPLFRMNNGNSIRLRAVEGPERPKKPFDLLTTSAMAQPKALYPERYEWPNGASMRPNSPTMHELLLRFSGAKVIVYEVEPGTALPDDLILVHEFADHYSMQAAKPMTVKELERSITQFLTTAGTRYTRDDWFARYPVPTEVA